MTIHMPTANRVILLGASNIAYGFPVMLDLLRCGMSGPIEVSAAFGHGRSYGNWSRVFFRELPGMLNCKLWQDLDPRAAHNGPTFALLTDIGNDLLYGVDPQLLGDWVAECLQRLKALQAEILLTQIPYDRLMRLTEWQFRIAKACFFPVSRVRWKEVRQQIGVLQQRVRELAEQQQIPCIEQPLEWYGYDPIHHRRSLKKQIWQQIFEHWSEFNCSTPCRGSTVLQNIFVQSLSASERKLAGLTLFQSQPVYHKQELKISLY